MAYPHLDSRPGDDPPAGLVRAELDRILASDLFTRSERLSAFLKFIVDQTLTGHGDSLKEQVIAVELYGKDADFNTAADPIVRVDARRLRDRLREYYATAPPRGIVISVPKGTYTPVFIGNVAEFATARGTIGANTTALHDADAIALRPAPAEPVPASTHDRLPARWWMAGVAVVLVVASMWGVRRLRAPEEFEPTLLTVTSMPGAEEDPSLSPDGNFVAFSWRGTAPNADSDIWIKAVDGESRRQLTNTPDALETWPVWSPDNRYVAFTRLGKTTSTSSVLMVSALGGPEQMIAEQSRDATWLPDSRSLVMMSLTPNGRFVLVHHVLETGARSVLIEAPARFQDIHPRVSPDGKTLAFSRQGDGRSALFVMPMAGGEATLLDEWRSGLAGGLEWTPDSREILYARPEPSGRRLVRVSVDGHRPAVPVASVPYGAINPSVSRLRGQTYRLAVSSGQPDVGLRLVDLNGPRRAATLTADAPFCDSTRVDTPGRFSPDGSQVAFVSDRSGTQQVWVANLDGSALRSVTQQKDATFSLGSWSPDGRFLTFDGTIGERTHIFVAPASGGPIKPLTEGSPTEIDPEWSQDGQWIFYASDESGQWAIWKMSTDGRTRVRLTSEVGYEPRQSPDGRSLYFTDHPRMYGLGLVSTLKRIPIDGGPAEVVVPHVIAGAWDVTDSGIVFVGEKTGPRDAPDTLQIYDFAERRVRPLGELAFRVGPYGVNHFLTVSRDGRWALVAHVDRWERDILVVDNFR